MLFLQFCGHFPVLTYIYNTFIFKCEMLKVSRKRNFFCVCQIFFFPLQLKYDPLKHYKNENNTIKQHHADT